MEDFKPMIKMTADTMVEVALDTAGKAQSLMAYCDYIANSIKHSLPVAGVYTSKVKSDLHPEGGYLLTTKKTIEAEYLGKKYIITVEEA
jgi:hypothetical protein